MESGGEQGYFEVQAPSPVAMVGFSITTTRGPAFKIHYSDDGSNWGEAAAVASSTVDSSTTWDCVGQHTYWRYTLDGDWAGGPWYHNVQWEYLVAGSGTCAGDNSPQDFDYSGSTCDAHAPHYAEQHGCDVSVGVLHWDQWMESAGEQGYFQVQAPSPVAMVGFSIETSRGPAYKIQYSDDGSNWAQAAAVTSSTVDSSTTWDCVGQHTYWRYTLDGDWAGGPWYHNIQWQYVDCCSGSAPVCEGVTDNRQQFDYSGSSCDAHAPYYQTQHGCDVVVGTLHWDQWEESAGEQGYFQVQAPSP